MIFLFTLALFSSFNSFTALSDGSLYDCTQFFHAPNPEGSAEMVAEFLFETTKDYVQKNGTNGKVNEVQFNLHPQAKNASSIVEFLSKVFGGRRVIYLNQLREPASDQGDLTYDPYTVLTRINELTGILWVISYFPGNPWYGFKGTLNPQAPRTTNMVTATTGH